MRLAPFHSHYTRRLLERGRSVDGVDGVGPRGSEVPGGVTPKRALGEPADLAGFPAVAPPAQLLQSYHRTGDSHRLRPAPPAGRNISRAR